MADVAVQILGGMGDDDALDWLVHHERLVAGREATEAGARHDSTEVSAGVDEFSDLIKS